MNIYLVKAVLGVDWDETNAYVCIVKDRDEALSLTAWCNGSPTEINNLHIIELIGKANNDYNKACIICEDVKWG